jgi:hypothetical protein
LVFPLHARRASALARRTDGDDNGLVGALQPVDLLIKLSDARSRSGSQRAAERQRPLSSRDRPSFAAVATAGMCQEETSQVAKDYSFSDAVLGEGYHIRAEHKDSNGLRIITAEFICNDGRVSFGLS